MAGEFLNDSIIEPVCGCVYPGEIFRSRDGLTDHSKLRGIMILRFLRFQGHRNENQQCYENTPDHGILTFKKLLYILRNCRLNAFKAVESSLEDGSVRADEHKVRNSFHTIDVCRH